MTDMDQAPASALLLGYGGVLPFAALAVNYVIGWPLFDGFALQAFLVYAAAILSFLGGIRWGAAVNLGKTRARELGLSVLPSLWAVAALLLPGPLWSVAALMLGFLLMGLLDGWVPGPAMPDWMARLRVQLTVAVLVCHGIMVGALLQ